MFFSVIIKIQIGKFELRIKLVLKDKMGLRMKNFYIFGVHWKYGGEIA